MVTSRRFFVLWLIVMIVAPNVLVGAFSLGLTGDVNLNPNLPSANKSHLEYVWGDMLHILQSFDILAINHESTMAEIPLSDPQTIQFEDPLDYQGTYRAAGVDFVSVANNHQFDFGLEGFANSIEQMNQHDIVFGGIANSKNYKSVMEPTIITVPTNYDDNESTENRIAFFTMVVDECWIWPNGTLYLDACTCGGNAGKSPAYQCYQANATMGGLWYNWGITDQWIKNVNKVIQVYRTENPHDLIIVFLHCGPNFQWHPYPAHEQLLRNISASGADIVWGTSSHHIQRLEYFNQKPIIYGLGDLLFRHLPGVDDFCPLSNIPCEAYRPELSLVYQFDIQFNADPNKPPVIGKQVLAYGTRHTDYQAKKIDDQTNFSDIEWIEKIFNELSSDYGASIQYNRSSHVFQVELK